MKWDTALAYKRVLRGCHFESLLLFAFKTLPTFAVLGIVPGHNGGMPEAALNMSAQTIPDSDQIKLIPPSANHPSVLLSFLTRLWLVIVFCMALQVHP